MNLRACVSESGGRRESDDKTRRVSAPPRDDVEPALFLAGAPCPVLLASERDRGGVGSEGRIDSDPARIERRCASAE